MACRQAGLEEEVPPSKLLVLYTRLFSTGLELEMRNIWVMEPGRGAILGLKLGTRSATLYYQPPKTNDWDRRPQAPVKLSSRATYNQAMTPCW